MRTGNSPSVTAQQDTSPLFIFKEAINRRRTGDIEKALLCFDEVIREAPSAEAHFERGLTYLWNPDIGDIREAIADFKKAIELNHALPEAHFQLGLAYCDHAGTFEDDAAEPSTTCINTFEQAISAFTTTIQLQPEHVGAFSHRAFAHCSVGEYDLAMKDCDEVLRLSGRSLYFKEDVPDEEELLRCLDSFLVVGRKIDAVDCRVEVFHVKQDEVMKNLILEPILPANLTAFLDSLSPLRPHAESQIWLSPQDMLAYLPSVAQQNLPHSALALTYYVRAYLHYTSNDFAAAARDCDQAILLTPQEVAILRLRAKVKQNQGDFRGVMTDLETIINLTGPEEASVIHEWAEAQRMLNASAMSLGKQSASAISLGEQLVNTKGTLFDAASVHTAKSDQLAVDDNHAASAAPYNPTLTKRGGPAI